MSNFEPQPEVAAEPVRSEGITFDIAKHIEDRLLALFGALPSTHPIFGEPRDGEVRLPLRAERANGQC